MHRDRLAQLFREDVRDDPRKKPIDLVPEGGLDDEVFVPPLYGDQLVRWDGEAERSLLLDFAQGLLQRAPVDRVTLAERVEHRLFSPPIFAEGLSVLSSY